MGAFLALTWDARDAQAAGEAGDLRAEVDAAGGWSPAYAGPGARVWVRGPRPPEVRGDARRLVIGVCLEEGRTRAYRLPDGPPETAPEVLARDLSQEAWGAYVALLGSRAIFRDPSGGLDCLTWAVGRVRLITSAAESPPPGLWPRRGGLDWRVIATWCQDSGSGAGLCGLQGIEVVGPGALYEATGGEGGGVATQRLIWRPSRFTARAEDAGRHTDEAVRHAVGLAVAGLVAPHERVLQEISGGLDSAVVAAALVARGLAPRVTGALNYVGARPEGDERLYAQAIADHLGLPLTCAPKPVEPLTEEDFRDASQGLRAGFAMVDPVRDRDTAARLRRARATGLVTGHGGDVVFFQMPTPLIAADRRRLAGLRGLSPGFVSDIARLTRRPAWTVLRAAFARDPGAAAAYRPPGFWPAAAPAAPWIDPWTEDCAAAPPAKRLQVRALHRAQLAIGASRRGRAADVIHPLLSQPVTELCLGLTTAALTRGGRDRVVARSAFRGRLPDRVIDRRSKGDLTAHYGQVIAASLPVLRPLLLDGCLAEVGLLDRRRLEVVLTPDRLLLERANSEILVAALIESWVRVWQTRMADAPGATRWG